MIEKEYIDLEETVTTLKRNSQKYFSSFHKGYVQAIEDLADIPAAKVSPVRHGRWETISDSDLSRTVMCSVCNNTFYYSKRREQLKIDMMPYCPHCGARMDEKERDEND